MLWARTSDKSWCMCVDRKHTIMRVCVVFAGPLWAPMLIKQWQLLWLYAVLCCMLYAVRWLCASCIFACACGVSHSFERTTTTTAHTHNEHTKPKLQNDAHFAYIIYCNWWQSRVSACECVFVCACDSLAQCAAEHNSLSQLVAHVVLESSRGYTLTHNIPPHTHRHTNQTLHTHTRTQNEQSESHQNTKQRVVGKICIRKQLVYAHTNIYIWAWGRARARVFAAWLNTRRERARVL